MHRQKFCLLMLWKLMKTVAIIHCHAPFVYPVAENVDNQLEQVQSSRHQTLYMDGRWRDCRLLYS